MKIFNIKQILFAGAVTSVLVSCAIQKDYTRPELNVPENYKQQVQVTGDTIVLPWKTFFKDPKLVVLIEKL